MKNRIWIGKNAGNDCIFSAKSKMIKNGDGYVVPLCAADELYTSEYLADFFGLNLKNGEIVEIIIDTETQKYVVKRLREIGWYLTVNPGAEVNFAAARHWNGEIWKLRPREKLHCSDRGVAVVSEIIRDNEYLKSLE